MLNYHYEAISGYFVQDDHSPKSALPPRFGLKDESDNRWSDFFNVLSQLNDEALPGTIYKCFFLTRHGQGYHNVAESKYRDGTVDWDNYWAKLNGDGEIVWGPDPKLTPLGIEQARAIHAVWILEAKFGLPAPGRRYCSPLTRALDTASIVFEDVFETYPNRIVVKENCREEMGVHTCDRRNTRSYITTAFPSVEVEAEMTEEDELWSATVRETHEEATLRAKTIIDYVFQSCDAFDTFISITAHSGFINGFLRAIGREGIFLPTGGVLPVVVKAVYGE